MTLQSIPCLRKAWLPAALMGVALLATALPVRAQTPDASSFQIQARPIQKVPTTFKFQARISQAKLPVGDPVFPQVFVQLVRGTTDVVCTETLSNVRVKQSVLNLEIGRGFTCPLDDIIAANNDLNFRICIESKDNCLKPIALSSVPYAIKATFSQQAQEAHTSDIAAQCHYAHRVTADTGLLSLNNQSQYGSGYYDYATPRVESISALTMPTGVTNTGGFVQWTPVNSTSDLTICQRGHGGQALSKLDVFNVQASSSYFSNAVYVGSNTGAQGEGYLEVDGDGLFHGNVDIVGITGAQEGTLTARSHIVSRIGNVHAENAEVIAYTNVRAQTGDVISENAEVIAETNVRAVTGDVVSEAAEVIAQTNVRAMTGNVVSEQAQVVAQTDVLANTGDVRAGAGDVIAYDNVRAETGDVVAQVDVTAETGAVTARTDVTALTGSVTAQQDVRTVTGGVTAETNVTARTGAVTAQTDVTAVTGSVTAETNVTAVTGSVTGQTDVEAVTGDVIARAGGVTAQTGMVSNTGDIRAAAGDIIAVRITNGSGTLGGSVRAVDGVFSGDVTAEGGTVTGQSGVFTTMEVAQGSPGGGFRVNAEGTVVFGGVPQFGDTVFSAEGHTHPGSDITSPISVANVPSLPASRVNSGTFDAARIPNLPASRINTGELALARIPDLPASQVTSGAFSPDRIPGIPASRVNSGSFDPDRIPGIPASRVNSGSFSTSRIPNLSASKITSGTLSSSRIPNLNANKITAGTLSTSRIPNLNASKITSGTINPARIKLVNGTTVTRDLTTWSFGQDESLNCQCANSSHVPIAVSCGQIWGLSRDNKFGLTSQYLESNGGGCSWRALATQSSGNIGTRFACTAKCLAP